MNIFKSSTFTWYEIGALKWAVFLIGIAVGAKWAGVFLPNALWLLIAGLALSAYVGFVWVKQL